MTITFTQKPKIFLLHWMGGARFESILSAISYFKTTHHKHSQRTQPTRFGIHSVSGIFQRELENRLPSIPFIKVQLKVQVKIMVNILTI